MRAKYQNDGDGNMTTEHFLLSAAGFYFPLRKSNQPAQLLFEGVGETVIRANSNRSGVEQ
jgi:hypothetical protein